MKTLFNDALRSATILAYTLFAWPLAAALSFLLGRNPPGAQEIARSRFCSKSGERSAP